MNSKDVRGWSRLVVGGALLAAVTLAQAQYVWVDDKGLKQFSDRPPPPTVPLKRILKAPGLPAEAEGKAEAPADGEAVAAAPAAKASPTLKEQNAGFSKRKADAEEKEKKAQQDAKHKAEVAKYCDSVRKNLKLLESERPVGSVDEASGIMGAEARTREIQKSKQSLEKCT